MILKDTILSVFNDKYTLLKWLKQLEKALKDDTLTAVTVNQTAEDKATFTFNFEGGGTITTPEITLPRGADGRQGIDGEKGEKGDKGDKGDTALSVTVGGTYTAPAGTQANVTNIGTDTDLILQFVIPQGSQGEKGDTGATGARGATGATGATGEKGDAATVTVGTVTTLPAGDRATVTNVGTKNDAVFNFGIPQGDKGESGTGGFADVTNLNLSTNIDSVATVDSGVQVNSNADVAMGERTAQFPVTMVLPVKGSDYITVDVSENGAEIIIKLDETTANSLQNLINNAIVKPATPLSSDTLVALRGGSGGEMYLKPRETDFEINSGNFNILKDTTPAANSTNALTSGGAYTALQGKLDSNRNAVATVGGLVKPLTTPTATELVGISTGMEQERVKIGDGLNYDSTTKTLSATGGGGGTGGTKLYRHETIWGDEVNPIIIITTEAAPLTGKNFAYVGGVDFNIISIYSKAEVKQTVILATSDWYIQSFELEPLTIASLVITADTVTPL